MVEDLTMYFQDNRKNLTARRKRVGLKNIMRNIFEKSCFEKNRFLLEDYDTFIFTKNDQLELQYHLSNFPVNKQ
jgi:hypothetical protein